MAELGRKALTELEWKADKLGSFRAVVATYNVVDKDGDVSVPGALDTPYPVLLSAWNHSSVGQGEKLPVGTATITTVGNQAIAEGQFIMDSTAGRDAYVTAKALYAAGGGPEWSYGYTITDASNDPKELSAWPGATRILKEVNPFEVSPVFRGAGVGTRTLSMKSAQEYEFKRGARLSKESTAHLLALAQQLVDFVGQATPDPDEPKIEPKADHSEELQAFLRATRDEMERINNRDRFVDLRVI